jgi:fructose-bisphosphate aldolase class 1
MVFDETFRALKDLNVCFEGMVLKPNMITKGK